MTPQMAPDAPTLGRTRPEKSPQTTLVMLPRDPGDHIEDGESRASRRQLDEGADLPERPHVHGDVEERTVEEARSEEAVVLT